MAVTRPADVDEEIYREFKIACIRNKQTLRKTLERLMKRYIVDGESVARETADEGPGK